jgi:cell division septum initiation protein DivIVA
MASKPRPAYTVAHSGGTYGAATPYAVVSSATGMPHLPAHASKEAAQQEADRLNAEAQRAAAKVTAAALRKAARLHAETAARDGGQAGEPA